MEASNAWCVIQSTEQRLCCGFEFASFIVAKPNVMLLVLQVYFHDHTGSLNIPNMDIQFEIMNHHSDFPIGSTFQICSPIGNIDITLPSYQ